MSEETWRCAGCHMKADSTGWTLCNCPTRVLTRVDGHSDWKRAACVIHPDQPSMVNLDGDDLCRPCADQWARNEGLALEGQSR